MDSPGQYVCLVFSEQKKVFFCTMCIGSVSIQGAKYDELEGAKKSRKSVEMRDQRALVMSM